MTFSKIILSWYATHKRTLPWRSSTDPYKIWLSEIILQQTRVAQGTPYYKAFISNFPKVQDLANAPEEKVLKLWQGLGYYSRARNLHATAKTIATEYNGKFPKTFDELLKLKGIGDYTASAIASICFNAPKAVVDGNVYRVLSRYFGIAIPINGNEGIKYFKNLAHKLMDAKNIRDYNQAIMEFGAIQCTPKKTNCHNCPLQNSCIAFRDQKVHELPVKINKTKIKHRYFNYLVPVSTTTNGDAKTILLQRTGKGIWQNLYEFPLIETEKKISITEIQQCFHEALPLASALELYPFNEKEIIHKLSHQHLHTTFWIAPTSSDLENGVLLSEIETYAVPVLVADFIKTFKKSYF